MRVSIGKVVASISVGLFALGIGSTAFGLKGADAPEKPLVTVGPAPQPEPTPAPTVRPDIVEPVVLPTEVGPDLTGVDWVALARHVHGRCGEWRALAEAIGWPADEWPTLSYVLYRESRCNIGSWNKTDTNGGSRGLMQINGYWCRPNRWSDAGWLQDLGILKTCEDLFNPEVNLRAGLAIWLYGENKHGCGWRGPWATPCGKFG